MGPVSVATSSQLRLADSMLTAFTGELCICYLLPSELPSHKLIPLPTLVMLIKLLMSLIHAATATASVNAAAASAVPDVLLLLLLLNVNQVSRVS